MGKPNPSDLNECLSIIERTPDEKEAERVLLFALGLLQMADDEFEDREGVGDKVATDQAHRRAATP
jgi:hypothetical protein